MRIDIYTRTEELPALLPGSIQHSALLFGLLCNSRSTKPYMMVASDEQGHELAHIIIIKRRGIRLLPPVAGSWFTIYGEGIYSDKCHNREEIFAKFIEKLFEISFQLKICKYYKKIAGNARLVRFSESPAKSEHHIVSIICLS